MPARTKTSTTRLPQSILEEIQKSDGNESSHRQRSSKHQLSRKDSRKQDRAARKHRKAEFFSSHPKRQAEVEHAGSPQRKRIKLDTEAGSTQPSSRPAASKLSIQAAPNVQKGASEVTKKTSKTKTKTSKAATPKLDGIVRQRSQQEKEEEAYIAYLESKLGHKQGKSSKRYNDGLDDLFDFASSLDFPSRKDTSAKSPEAEDTDLERGEDNVEEDDGSESDSEEVKEGPGEISGNQEDFSDEEWHGIHVSEDESDSPTSLTSPASEPNAPSTAPAMRYVPPHLRSQEVQDSKNSEALVKLTRQLKGLLNRMSEQNIASIVDSIEEVYRNHRRNDVTSTLTTLIIDGICSHSSLLDSYVVLYAAFVSSLHKIVGIEFAAHFVQNVVNSYEHHLSSLQEDASAGVVADTTAGPNSEDRGKEASNLVVLLSELYNFQVISCILIFDIIRALLHGDMQEFQVELLLKVVKTSGHQLRQDDPSALKDIVQIVDTKLAGDGTSLSSRARFMLETLHNLKNNKVKRLGAQNQGGDAVERMKRFLSGLSKKRQVAHEPLRVTLDDLHSAESKGKWWLVGAAWGGDPLIDRQQEAEDTNSPSTEQNSEGLASTALVKLARKQGMNTDIRRSIFVVLMSSDDYIDACERLSQLKLTEVQQREIIRVLFHCCGNVQEKAYNPYYTLVCQHLCSLSHSYKITLQYCLWDFLRDLGEKSVGGAELIKSLKDGGDDFDVKSISSTRIGNVAKAYGWLIAKDCVGLTVLKPVDFTVVKPRTRGFLRELFIQLFLSSQTSSPLIGPGHNLLATRNRAAVEEIFIKATRLQALSMGLMYFFSRDLLPDETEDVDPGTVKLAKWGAEVAKETLRTGLDVVPNM